MASPGERERTEDAVPVADVGRKVSLPPLYRVVLHNDDYTTMEFVVEVLVNVFYHTAESAVRIMLEVHHRGAGTAGTYPHEVAESKAGQVHRLARAHQFPLRCTVEPG
jgi:ATP-dependent Clp protease adaptor protein ClpS